MFVIEIWQPPAEGSEEVGLSDGILFTRLHMASNWVARMVMLLHDVLLHYFYILILNMIKLFWVIYYSLLDVVQAP